MHSGNGGYAKSDSALQDDGFSNVNCWETKGIKGL